jgi:glyoxylase-like metal-dependent hydrolase (beta-lactamase superfamily II)
MRQNFTVYQIDGVGYDSNVYVIKSEEGSLIVDSGTGFNLESVLSNLHRVEKDERIEAIFLTHEHFDHVGGVPGMIKAIGKRIKIVAHPLLGKKAANGRIESARFFGEDSPKFKVDFEVEDLKNLKLAGMEITFLHTPGHSRGSITIFFQDEGLVFPGDLIFAGGGVGRWDMEGGDFVKLKESVRRVSDLSPRGIFPGHGPFTWTDAKGWLKDSLRSLEGQ